MSFAQRIERSASVRCLRSIALCVLAFLVSGHFSLLFSQRLLIRFSSNDCVNCISSFNLLRGVPKAVSIEIVCSERNEAFIKNHIASIAPNLHNRISYRSRPNRTKSISERSSCTYFIDRKEINFDLVELPTYMELIMASSIQGVIDSTFQLPELSLSDRLEFNSSMHAYSCTDYLSGRSFIISCTNSIFKFIEIKAPETIRKKAIFNSRLDTSYYYSRIPDIISDGNFNQRIIAVSPCKKEAYGMFQIAYLRPTEVYARVTYAVRIPILTEDSSIYISNINGYLTDTNYLFNPYAGLTYMNGRIAASIVPFAEMRSIPCSIGMFSCDSGICEMISAIGPVPKKLFNDGPANHYYLSGFEDGFHINRMYPFVTDPATSSTIDYYSIFFNKGESIFESRGPNFWFLDYHVDDLGNAYALYQFGNDIWLVACKAMDNEIIFKRKIEIDNIDGISLRFIEGMKLIAISKNADVVTVIK